MTTKTAIELPDELEFRTYTRPPTIPPIDQLMAWTDEQILAWEARAKVADKQLMEDQRWNRETEDRWAKVFESRGGSPRGARGGKAKWFRDAMTAMGRPTGVPGYTRDYLPYWKASFEVNGEKVEVRYQNCTFMQIAREARRLRDLKVREQCHKGKYETRLAGLAPSLNIDPLMFDNTADFLKATESAARDKWIAENFPDGTEVPIDFCDRCDTWTVGDHRCSCGNVRVSLEISGNAMDGYYAYGSAF